MASSNAVSDLYKAHQVGQERYAYFLLAASGAAIGFAVQKTEGLHLSWWLLPVALATLCWACSFYCGCKNIDSVHASIGANSNLLQLKQGTHPGQPPHPQLVEVAISTVSHVLDGNIRRAGFYGRWQFRFLVSGAALFIGWRVVEMVRSSL